MITRMFSTATLEPRATGTIAPGGIRWKTDAAPGRQAPTGMHWIFRANGLWSGPRLAARHSARTAA